MKYENKHSKTVIEIYDNYDEDSRLTRSRHGQLEYLTTMHFIHKYLKPKMKILEIGAGTGRYSIALAKEGFAVTAVELVKSNLKVLKQNAKGLKNLKALQGDGLDLSKIKNETFDLVLCLGPMYHLYTKQDQNQAITEALRVAKQDGVVMFAFLPIASMIFGWGMEGEIKRAIQENFTKDYKVIHSASQGFTGFDISEFESLFKDKEVQKLHMVATDSIMDLEEDRTNFYMTDEDFDAFSKYHLATCEKLEMLGLSFHALYICKKK